MGWIKNYHDDHMAVLLLLAKLEGNIKLLEIGQETPHTMMEFKEFARVLEKVIIPHFKSEEQNAYVEGKKKDDHTRAFIDEMLEEHRQLHLAFHGYLEAIAQEDHKEIIENSSIIVDVLHKHIIKEEKDLPALLEN